MSDAKRSPDDMPNIIGSGNARKALSVSESNCTFSKISLGFLGEKDHCRIISSLLHSYFGAGLRQISRHALGASDPNERII